MGKNEQELTKENVPYEYGVARYSDLAKGMMQGDEVGGLLKILFHLETHKILGKRYLPVNSWAYLVHKVFIVSERIPLSLSTLAKLQLLLERP